MAPHFSFELFPPRNEGEEEQLWRSLDQLSALAPRFVAVTYGAGGSTQERTHKVVERLLHDTSIVPAAHLTCVGASRAEVDAVAERYWDAGVRHIVALRGDAPRGQRYQPHPAGYAYAADLVAGLRRIGDFEISVAAYPEGHTEARGLEDDLDNLKRKLDAGATQAITQYCFETETHLRFLDRCLAAGITAPIVPGIMPIASFRQAAAFSARCGASVPDWLERLFAPLEGRPEIGKSVAVGVAVEQLRLLHARGLRHFHIYTLNRPDLAEAVTRLARLWIGQGIWL